MDRIIAQNLRHHWHPASQMKDYETLKPLPIKSAKGTYLKLTNGKEVIDAISSWWCKSLGHNHPRLKRALLKQVDQFEHVIGTNTCNQTLAKLSEKLGTMTKTLSRVFYAGDGSSAVEIAMKMSLHSRQITGESGRYKFMALQNGYHGETLLALSASDLQQYRQPYEKIAVPVLFIPNIPYVSSKEDPLWKDCSASWPAIETFLNHHATDLTAIIVEPIVQGAGGMLIYSQDFLRRLRGWTLRQGMHLIADEIMTGIGRTGLPLACGHSDIESDFICLSKGLTAGWLPFSAVLIQESIYQLFYNDYRAGKNFLHSHTYSGNALGAAVALEILHIMEEEGIYEKTILLETVLKELMERVAQDTEALKNIRHLGGIVAADLSIENADPSRRYGFEIFSHALDLGAFLRPLGETVYWLPPLNIKISDLEKLSDITQKSIQNTLRF